MTISMFLGLSDSINKLNANVERHIDIQLVADKPRGNIRKLCL
jgi:hypothetical protein